MFAIGVRDITVAKLDLAHLPSKRVNSRTNLQLQRAHEKTPQRMILSQPVGRKNNLAMWGLQVAFVPKPFWNNSTDKWQVRRELKKMGQEPFSENRQLVTFVFRGELQGAIR